MVFGIGGLVGAITGSIKSKMVAGGHLGMMALLRVILASAGLSFSVEIQDTEDLDVTLGPQNSLYRLDFRPVSHRISETVQDSTNVATDH